MTLLETIADLRTWRTRAVGPVVLVPTMGALHEGHLQLVREARAQAGEGGQVVVSLFVNPLQFGPNEDFARYPRTFEEDLAGSASAGADAVFAPAVAEIYHPDRSIQVSESALSKVLCGSSRPGHFDGVCTVVAKLFNLVQPHSAVFGKKDFQQLAIIRRLVRDLDFPVRIVALETVREPDGLAMSSRNRYLTAAERAQAPQLRAALLAAHADWESGISSSAHLKQSILAHLTEYAPLGRVDYIDCVDADSLTPLGIVRQDQHAVIALAVFFGKARLIDNIELIRFR
jgi:pantoate--beta-alanine ligase